MGRCRRRASWVARKLLGGVLLLTAAGMPIGNAGQAAGPPAPVAQCPAGGRTFAASGVVTQARDLQRFMMVSAWHLEPYPPTYLDNVLPDLARHRAAGIVYGTLGATTAFLRAFGRGSDEDELNRRIYAAAQRVGASIWLQLRLYDNTLGPGGAPFTAEAILSNQTAMAAMQDGVAHAVALYDRYFHQSCKVIVFEEAGIYHRPEAGGTFWSSSPTPVGRPDPSYDDLFAGRMSQIFGAAQRAIKSVAPQCSVGMHLGHEALQDRPVLQKWFGRLAAENSRPSFMLYDLYLKAQAEAGRYGRLLQQRAGFVQQQLGVPVLHLGQAQTMNGFQHGLGATPSRAEIDYIVDLDLKLGLAGIGFYNKNAVPTARVDNDPMDPNTVGQATVFESSRDRWDYVLLKLFETSGVHFSDLFDLVLSGHGGGPSAVQLLNHRTGAWDPIGTVGGNGIAQPAMFRAIDVATYMPDRRQVDIRLATGPGSATSTAAVAWLIPSEPAATFRTAASVAEEIARSGTVSSAQATAEVTSAPAALCLH